MIKKIISFMLITFLIIGTVGCSSKGEEKIVEPISKTEFFMGTVVKVTTYNGGSEEILDKVFNRVKEIEDSVSINKNNTELDKLNENAGKSPVKLSDTAYEVVKRALYFSEESKGGYDLTIGPLVKLWSIGLPEAKVPTKEEIDAVKSQIDYSKVIMNDETKEVFLSEENMAIDLGSIAKGYAADEIVKMLKTEGVEQAIVDLGGNIYAMGKKNNESDWKIGIQNPFDNRGNVVGTIEVHDKTVVTSGIYERYIEKDGVKYHHILNPKTGYPYESEIAGVSIISDKSIDGDALSTLIFTKGIEEGVKFLNEIDSVEAIFISKDKKVYLTSGMKDKFKLLNQEFVISDFEGGSVDENK